MFGRSKKDIETISKLLDTIETRSNFWYEQYKLEQTKRVVAELRSEKFLKKIKYIRRRLRRLEGKENDTKN